MNSPAGLLRTLVIVFPVCFLSLPAAGQGAVSRQAMCQESWDRCLGTIDGGKNWKPLYDQCKKARSACLGGLSYSPPPPSVSSTYVSAGPLGQDFGSGSDQANADPATRAARCDDAQPRGERGSCTLANDAEGYGQSFSLLGPGVPMARAQRSSSVVKCAGGKMASFYANGRIESCSLDNYSALGISLTDVSGKPAPCATHSTARFDPEGRLLSCY